MSSHREQRLTLRELQVARLVRDGLTDRGIAERLFISRRTAEWHLKQIFNKLGVSSRAQVAAWIAHEQAAGIAGPVTDTRRNNLPVQLTTFVGRADELAELARLLATRRLVTLIGVAGIGKTRLAQEVTAQTIDAYPDGAWLVDLTPIHEGRLIPGAFGSALRVHERPRQPMSQTVVQHLRGRRLLLLVDNCEHLLEDCARLVDAILRSSDGVTILATSREPLRVNGETVWRVRSLTVPDPGARMELDDLPRYEAVRLFLDRAQLATPAFQLSAQNAAAVGGLCSGLDGIPLGIELAAARTSVMTPDQILNRLQDRFVLLTGGSRTGPARHRTLQSALDWSHDLLTVAEQTLFRRLSVFAGSFSLEAIEYVCSGDDLEVAAVPGLLASLVDKSLVVATPGGSTAIRFRILETLHQYGRERLEESGEVERLQRRHCEFFVALAEEALVKLRGPDLTAWHDWLVEDISNLRVALAWSHGREPVASLRMSCGLYDFWLLHGLVLEGDGWAEGALADYAVRDEVRAAALGDAGWLSLWCDDIRSASARWSECLDIYRELSDRRGVGLSLVQLGTLALWKGDFRKTHEYGEAGLAILRELEDAEWIWTALRHLGLLAVMEHDHTRARVYLEESLSWIERSGNQRQRHHSLQFLGMNALESGDYAAARSHLDEALTIASALDFRIGVASSFTFLAVLAAAESNPIRAMRLAGASETLSEPLALDPIRLSKPLVERWLEPIRQELGPERSTVWLAEGRAMPEEDAIEYALRGE
jgi:predicted ATPase/DNA-binding CsgD family transcriptional regulator